MIADLSTPTQTPVQAAEAALLALEILAEVERTERPPTADERLLMAQYPGMGRLALDIFPHSQTGEYKSPRWRHLGERLRARATPEDYASLKRSVFTAFYTSPLIMQTLWDVLARFGVPKDAHVFEPGCGIGSFWHHAPTGTRLTGVELDRVSARLAQALYPQHTVTQGSIASVPLPPNTYDAVIGNVPFADLHYTYWGLTLSLHELCLARALDVLKPGGVMALVVTHFLLDRQASDLRLALAARAEFLGAIRLPDDAFQAQGTRVVCDLVFFLKRDTPTEVLDPDTWTQSVPLTIDGVGVAFNQMFAEWPEWVLGHPTRKKRLYGATDTYTIQRDGDFPAALEARVQQLPRDVWHAGEAPQVAAVHGVGVPAHCQEGSFFVVGEAIYQVQHGAAIRAMHGRTVLSAYHGKTGRRLAHLIELRDYARAVLWAQTSGQSAEARDKARKELSRCYGRFVMAYGAINHTVVHGDEESGEVRRSLPNLRVFSRDPDAQFVMALEDYSESRGTAEKAPLLTRDVLPALQPPTPVTSAEQALLVSLNDTNTVDLAYMAQRYGEDAQTILDELGDLVYYDPAAQAYVDASTYLAGNVRQKLREAQDAGPEYTRNVEALTEVQPPDLPPSQIDANPGTPWVPLEDMVQFAHETFEVEPSMRSWALTVKHLNSEALWSVHAERFVKEGTAASVTYGTARADGVRLLEDTMNGRLVTIYDYHEGPGGDTVRVLNDAETVAARDKQRALTAQFRTWLFGDQARTERLGRAYNDRFNAMRRQAFDGAHLTFPGLSTHLTPYHTQVDAVWRILCTGNTLLAHDVGFGKTLICLMAAAKMKQLGLIRKPMFVVLNSTLMQWTRAAPQAYPTGKYLMATKDDCTPRRRKFLAAKIATGDWDGIMITHTSFEKLGMSKEYQERFLTQKVEEYERVLASVYEADDAEKHRNFIKRIEKRKAHYEEKLEVLMDKGKDDGLVFDELGVDMLFVDEGQYYKNYDTPSKSSGVAGVSTGGSDRAFDLGMKLAFLRTQYPARQTVFATATPISNSITEIFTMQRYLDPDGLAARDIDTFDAWLSVFGQQKERYEIAVDGASLRPRVRIDLQNLTDLQQLFLGFTDVRTHKDIQLPIPQLAGGKPQTVVCPMSPTQHALQQDLVQRYEKIRQGGVPPKVDNALKITGEGRKLAIDARLLVGGDVSDAKLEALVDNVVHLWQQGHGRKTAQLIFSDIGVNPTTWGFSFYDAVILELVARNVPRQAIGRMDEADTDAKKFVLMEQVKRGDKRVVLGSTERMGTGANLQDRLVAVHHVDPPWKPSQIQQRNGRLLRQGNLHYDWGVPVHIFQYVTEGSFDAFMWQAMQTKARLVGYIMDGSNVLRRVEDIGEHELSYAEVKAIASGNPHMMTLAEADADVTRLTMLKRTHDDRLYNARLHLAARPADIDRHSRAVAAHDADLATLKAHANETHYTLDGTPYAADQVRVKLETRLVGLSGQRFEHYDELGTYQGLTFGIHVTAFGGVDVYLKGQGTTHRPLDLRRHRGDAVLEAVDELVSDLPRERAQQWSEVRRLTRQLAGAATQSTEQFAQAAYLEAYTALRDQLRTALTPNPPEGHPEAGTLATQITALKKQHGGPVETAEETGTTAPASVSASLSERIAARHATEAFAEGERLQGEAADEDAETTAPQGARKPARA